MADVKNAIASVDGWLKTITEFLLSVIFAFVVLDILFPGTTGVINNINEIVSSFADGGVTGLIALLLFMLIYRR